MHSVRLCFGLPCELANGAPTPNSISLKHAQNGLFQVNTLVFCNTSIFPAFVSLEPELEIVLAHPRMCVCVCVHCAFGFSLAMSQQSKLTSRSSASSLQSAVGRQTERLQSDVAASGRVQRACLLLPISLPLTFRL